MKNGRSNSTKRNHFLLQKKNIFLVLLFFFFSLFTAQPEKRVESSLKEANLMVFDNPDQAIKIIQNLHSNWKDSDENYFDSLLILASAYTAKGNNKQAIDYGLQAFASAEKNDDYKNQIRALGFLGNQYYNLNMRNEANYYLNKAENIISSHPKINGLQLIKGNIYYIKGLDYKNNLDCNFALNYFDKALNEYGKGIKNESSLLNISIVQIQKAYCLIDNNKIIEARQLIEKSLEISTNNNFTEHISNAEIALSQIYSIQGDDKKAQEILLETAKNVNSSSGLSLKLDLYNSLSKKSLKLLDYKNFQKYSEMYLATKKISNQLALQSFKNLLNEIGTIKNNEVENQERKYFLAFLSVVVLFLSLAGFLIYKIMASKSKNI